MNCSELREHYELYAFGLADDPERAEIRAHLDRGCEVCMAEMKRARGVMALLGGSAAPAAPSPKLRRRILASIGFEQRGFGWAPWLAGVAALSLVAAVYFAGREADFSREVVRLTEQARNQSAELAQLNEAFAILNQPDTTFASFGEKQPKPKGKVFVNPAKGMLLIASNLPPAPAGKMYEFWVFHKDRKDPIRGGMFQSDSDGTAMHMEHGPINMANMAAVAVTLEVASGVDAPTSAPVIVAPMPPALQ